MPSSTARRLLADPIQGPAIGTKVLMYLAFQASSARYSMCSVWMHPIECATTTTRVPPFLS